MKNIVKVIKAAIIPLIVAFVFVFIISIITTKICGEKFIMATNLIDLITVRNDKIQNESKPVLNNNKLDNKPLEGARYGILTIDSIDLEMSVYYGQSYTVLKGGLGHDTSSYFPGEGGSVIYMGHNFKGFLDRLPEVQNGDLISLETDYGTFEYTVYDSQIVLETEVEKVPIQDESEILMIYTCYPINNIGHAYKRYVVYAKPVEY